TRPRWRCAPGRTSRSARGSGLPFPSSPRPSHLLTLAAPHTGAGVLPLGQSERVSEEARLRSHVSAGLAVPARAGCRLNGLLARPCCLGPGVPGWLAPAEPAHLPTGRSVVKATSRASLKVTIRSDGARLWPDVASRGLLAMADTDDGFPHFPDFPDLEARRHQIFFALTEAEIARLDRIGERQVFEDGALMFEEGKVSPGMLVILS